MTNPRWTTSSSAAGTSPGGGAPTTSARTAPTAGGDDDSNDDDDIGVDSDSERDSLASSSTTNRMDTGPTGSIHGGPVVTHGVATSGNASGNARRETRGRDPETPTDPGPTSRGAPAVPRPPSSWRRPSWPRRARPRPRRVKRDVPARGEGQPGGVLVPAGRAARRFGRRRSHRSHPARREPSRSKGKEGSGGRRSFVVVVVVRPRTLAGRTSRRRRRGDSSSSRGPGCAVGGFLLLTGQKAAMTIRAGPGGAVVAALPHSAVARLARAHPHVYANVAVGLARRLRPALPARLWDRCGARVVRASKAGGNVARLAPLCRTRVGTRRGCTWWRPGACVWGGGGGGGGEGGGSGSGGPGRPLTASTTSASTTRRGRTKKKAALTARSRGSSVPARRWARTPCSAGWTTSRVTSQPERRGFTRRATPPRRRLRRGSRLGALQNPSRSRRAAAVDPVRGPGITRQGVPEGVRVPRVAHGRQGARPTKSRSRRRRRRRRRGAAAVLARRPREIPSVTPEASSPRVGYPARTVPPTTTRVKRPTRTRRTPRTTA